MAKPSQGVIVDTQELVNRARRGLVYLVSRWRRGPESDKASAYWGSLPNYHLTNDRDPIAIERSCWLADTVVPSLGLTSLLEVGTNSGRNLEYIRRSHPDIELKGIDVNPRAIEYAKAKNLDISFEVADANRWAEARDRWDAALTMSVLDHIPDDAAEALAANLATSARHVIAVELWDGGIGRRAVYKYSRDSQALFERNGFATISWEKAPGQYDEERSLLWVFIGRRQ
jgi:SAM-dependent methyltransferase